MHNNNIRYKIQLFVWMLACLLTVGCSDNYENGETDKGKDCLTIHLNISGSTTRGSSTIKGQDDYNENTFNTLDLFFYKKQSGTNNYGDDNTVAVYHYHAEPKGNNTVELSLNGFEDLTKNRGSSYKVIAIANCAEANIDDLSKTSIGQLKALKTKADAEYNEENNATHAFRYNDAPKDFVMTNFEDNNNIIAFDSNNAGTGTLTFKRVAAKIRLALDVVSEITDDNNETWKPRTDEIHLYISNGVRTARLDGGDADLQDPYYAGESDEDYKAYLEASDYYSILTSGSRQTQDYQYSREVMQSTIGSDLDGKVEANNYMFFNAVPYYTYPNTWIDSPIEAHQTKLTLVVPWQKTSGSATATTYKPTYYTVPVVKCNADGIGKIVSNAYYYLRTHIGMMGSVTPETPVEIDVESQIAEWGTANETEADIRSIRYLEINQTEYDLNNVYAIDVPFNSTHNCAIKNVNITYYTYTSSTGIEMEADRGGKNFPGGANSLKVSSTNTNYTFTCTLDNLNKIVHFNHDFYKAKNYSRYEVVITIYHPDDPTIVGTAEGEYEKEIKLTVYPAIYITVESHDGRPNPYSSNNGWILVNGYGNSTSGTGDLGPVKNYGADSHVMLTLTVTNLNETEKIQWVIDDPRTNFINNELDDISMQSDLANHFTTWENGNNGGPYDGSKYGGGSSGNRWYWASYDARTIWEWYTGEPWTIDYVDENDNKQTWNAQNDANRPLKYYYPTSELPEKGNVIGPRITFVSGYAWSDHQLSHANARRRCATYQQYGYPAGRWRLPTIAEMQLLKRLAKTESKVKDVFGGSNNWSSQGVVNTDGTIENQTLAYVRCVYDTWYWERYDKNGKTMNRIPEGTTIMGSHDNSGNPITESVSDNWKIFVWGDRPKENPQNNAKTRGISNRSTEVERFLEEWQGIH